MAICPGSGHRTSEIMLLIVMTSGVCDRGSRHRTSIQGELMQ